MLEAELYKLLEDTADAAIVADSGGITRFWNLAAEKLFGYPASEAVGRPCAELIDGRDAVGTAVCGQNCTILESCASGRKSPSVDLEARASGQRRLWVNMSTLQFHDTQGSPFTIHLMRDIAQRKNTEELGDKLLHAAHELVALAAQRTHAELVSPLSAQERRVLRSLAQGRSPTETGARLKITPRTFRNHLYNVNRKLGTRNRLAAVVHAIRHGLI